MKSSRIKLLIIVVISFFMLVAGRNGFGTTVKIAGQQLLVNGTSFTIRGVGYSPIPIGVDPEITPPYGDYFTLDYKDIYERDLPLLRQMGANAISLRAGTNNASHNDFLDNAYNNGIKPIYVIVTFPLNPSVYPDIT